MSFVLLLFQGLFFAVLGYAIVFWLVPFIILMVFLFYRWLVKVLICPLFWMMGSHSPRKLFLKIGKAFLQYIFKPITMASVLIVTIGAFLLYGAMIVFVLIVSLYLFGILSWHHPVYLISLLISLIYVKVFYPRYKKAYGSRNSE